MKKKIIAALVGICTVVVMTGCGNKGISNDKITIKQYKGLEVEKSGSGRGYGHRCGRQH